MRNDKKIVILQINSFANWGSTGRISEGIGRIIVDAGWASHIAYGRGVSSSSSVLYKIGSNLHVFFHIILTRFFDLNGSGSILSTRRLISYIEEVRPDIIHLHNLHGYYLNLRILFQWLKKSNIPIVWTLHDCWPFTGHCAYFDFVGCEKWVTQCYSCPQKNSYPRSFFIDRSKYNFNEKSELFAGELDLTIVTPSNWLSKLVKRSFLKAYEVNVFPNGIDLNTFNWHRIQTRNVEKKHAFRIIGVASIWDKRKGLKDFLKLARILGEEYHFILVGVPKKKSRNFPDNIIAVNRTNNPLELAELYNESDVYVNPTYEDNFPTTNLEALACGLPVITYDTGGSAECLGENTGYIVSKGDVEGLAAAIIDVKLKTKDYFSNACSIHAASNYDQEKMYRKYLELYNRILNRIEP
jgi:putative colanic acid biosynthesis glycosyltransferase